MAHRYGLERVAEGGAAAAGRPSQVVAARARRAIELYEQFAQDRPPNWPPSGTIALLALASQRRAASLAGDVARLLILSRQMRAAALERDTQRLASATARAQRRASRPAGRLRFRHGALRRWQSPEQLRQRVRDEVLLTDGDPAQWPNAALALGALPHETALVVCAAALTAPDACEALDGIGARAARYCVELARGRFQLPPTWRQITPANET